MAQTPASLQLQAGVQVQNPVELETDRGPYVSTAEANAAIVLAKRFIGKKVLIVVSNVPTEYWWSGGIADGNLIAIINGGGGLTSFNGRTAPAAVPTTGDYDAFYYTQVQSDARYLNTTINQLPNQVYAGPSSGSAALPTFRNLTISDIPSLNPEVGLRVSDNFVRASLGGNWMVAGTAGWAIVSNKLVAPTGTGINDNLYYAPQKTILYKNGFDATLEVGDLNTAGIAVGFRSSTNFFAWLDTTTSSASVIRIYLNGTQMRITNTSNPETISVASGDVYEMKVRFDKYAIRVSILKSTGESISSEYSINFAENTNFPKAGNLSFAAMGGANHKCDGISFYDRSAKYFSIKVIGDSILFGSGSTVLEDSTCEIFAKAYKGVEKFCAAGLAITDIDATVLLELQQQFVPGQNQRILFELGYNDIANGRTATQVNTDTDTIVSTLTGYGYIVDLATLLPNVSAPNQAIVDVVNTYRRTKSSTNKIIDFAKSITTDDLFDGTHPNNIGVLSMANLLISSYENILTRSDYVKPNYFKQYPEYSILENGYSTISASVANTDSTINVTNTKQMYPNAYYLISNGTSNEIVYVGGIANGKIIGVLRAQFGTTALTISASPTSYVIGMMGRLNFSSMGALNFQVADGYRSKHFYNCNGPLLSNEEIYRFHSLDSSLGRFVFSGDGNIGLCLNKQLSTYTSNILFGDYTNYRYQIQHNASNILIIGQFSGSLPNITLSPNGQIGIFTSNYIYRTTNAGADVTPRFLVDSTNSIISGNTWLFDVTGELGLAQGNGTRRIKGLQLRAENISSVAGSEAMDLGIYTQTGGGTLALRALVGTYGIQFPTAGQGLQIKGGSNARVGTAVLFTGTITIANTSITSNTIVIPIGIGTSNAGALSYTINAGVGFTINSTSITDARNISYVLIEII